MLFGRLVFKISQLLSFEKSLTITKSKFMDGCLKVFDKIISINSSELYIVRVVEILEFYINNIPIGRV